MNAEGLRSLQAPLKKNYRATPEDAQIILSAEGQIGDSISCKVETGNALAVAGLHPSAGGTTQSICSGNMLLEALAACAGVTLSAVTTAMNIELRSVTLKVEGSLDFRGTMGISNDAPVGFSNIQLAFTLDSEASEKQLSTLLRLTEKYCVVYQTLAQSPTMTVSQNNS